MAQTHPEMSGQLTSPQEAPTRPFSRLPKGPGNPLWALSPSRSENSPWVSFPSQKPGCVLADPPPYLGPPDVVWESQRAQFSILWRPNALLTQALAWSRPPSFSIWAPRRARSPSPRLLPHPAPDSRHSGHSGLGRPQSLSLCLCPPSLPSAGISCPVLQEAVETGPSTRHLSCSLVWLGCRPWGPLSCPTRQ